MLCVCLALLSPPSNAADHLSLTYWNTAGSQAWRTTFPVDGASELRYPADGNYIIGSYEKQLAGYSIKAEGGISSRFRAGTGSDSDWDYTRSQALWYYGEFSSGGSGDFFNIDRVGAGNPQFFWGYGYSHNRFTMTQGRYITENYVSQDPNHLLPDLASTYDITYQGPHVGFRSTTKLTPVVSLLAAVTYSPFAVVNGHGWWNLRDMEFGHIGSGQMLDTDLALQYNPPQLPDSALLLGYRFQQHSLIRGGENGNPDIRWEKAIAIRHGIYLSGRYRF